MSARSVVVPTVTAFLVASSLAGCPADRPPTPFWGPSFATGPHPVGFRSSTISRPTPDGEPRRVTLSVWYPAGADGSRMVLGELLALAVSENQLSEARGLAPAAALAAVLTGDSTAIRPDSAGAALAAPTLAVRDAPPAAGPFPLALWGVRHATVLAQAPLAEVLASHGVVVATVWSSDPPLAFIWEEEKSLADRLGTIDVHAEDLRFVLAALRADPTVDAGRTVVLAWSYGGQTAARIQETEDGVRAVISLDANVAPHQAHESLRLRHPLLWFVGQDTARRGLGGVDTLGSAVLLTRLEDLRHGDFNAMEGYLPARLGATGYFPWAGGGRTGRLGYEALVRMVTTAVRAFQSEEGLHLDSLAARLREVARPAGVAVSLRGVLTRPAAVPPPARRDMLPHPLPGPRR